MNLRVSVEPQSSEKTGTELELCYHLVADLGTAFGLAVLSHQLRLYQMRLFVQPCSAPLLTKWTTDSAHRMELVEKVVHPDRRVFFTLHYPNTMV